LRSISDATVRSNQGGAVHGVYFYFTLEVLLRFMMVVGMAFAALAAYFIIIAEWFANPPPTKPTCGNWFRFYLVAAVVYSVAGALYALRP